MAKAAKETDDLKKLLRAKRKEEPRVDFKRGLSSGSTLLNLACTGTTHACYLPGFVYWLTGDSQSGKTWLGHTALAEASVNSAYKDYRLIFDDAERGALMDVRKYFGPALEKRIEPPARDKDGAPVHSAMLEDFYYHIHDAYKARKPFIYFLDSMDALFAEEDEKKFLKRKRASRNPKEEEKVAGSFGMAKAKLNSSALRYANNWIKDSGSILIAISQTRQKTGFGVMPGNDKTRSGGMAAEFYATYEIWTSIKQKIKKKVLKKDREIGTLCRVRLKKNRTLGKDRTVLLPILQSHGIDDTGSLIAYLADEGHWEVSRDNKGEVTEVKAREFEFEGAPEKLARTIEEAGRDGELRLLVADVWADIEAACADAAVRKNKYQEVAK